jgi:asparagine synthase (glutamine-hydrolysing)
LPPEIWSRHKQPYRAPIHPSFFTQRLDYVEELLSPGMIQESGYFDPDAVVRLKDKVEAGGAISESEGMAIVGILSTQLLYYLFAKSFASRAVQEATTVRICRREE